MAAWTFLQAGHLGKKAKFRKLVWTDYRKFKVITAHSVCQSIVQREANGLEAGTFGTRICVVILVQCTHYSHTPCSLCRHRQRPCMMALCCVAIVCVTERKRSGLVTLKRV